MDEIVRLAREMGKAIQASEEYKRIMDAQKANDADEALQKDIDAFQEVRDKMTLEMQNEKQDEEKTKALDAELRAVYQKIMENPNMLEFNIAKQGIDRMMNAVTNILYASVNGENPDTAEAEPHNCGGSCSSCSGCH